jgi:pyrimidine oxygenase
MRDIEYGVFLPVGSGGWIPSTNAPHLDGSYRSNRTVVQLAEQLGFHFTLSQAVWRGNGGATRHFDDNLESLTTTAGFGEITERIGLWGTVNTSMLHPAVAAKIVATADQISGGRSGLNIVAGGNRAAERQMGIGLDLDNPDKYRRAAEWVSVVKALWTEPSVDFDGEFFTLRDCQSGPKPVQGVPPMICAATSDAGLRFVAEHLDGVMFEGITDERVIEVGQRTRRIAHEQGAEHLKSHCISMVVPGETDADAARRVEHYSQAKDTVALAGLAAEFGAGAIPVDVTSNNIDAAKWAETMALSTGTLYGSPETLAERLAGLADAAELDSMIFIMPDFVDDLRVLGEEVLPILERNGYGTRMDPTLGPLVRT